MLAFMLVCFGEIAEQSILAKIPCQFSRPTRTCLDVLPRLWFHCAYIYTYLCYIYTSSIYIHICTLTLVMRIAIPILTNGCLYGGVKLGSCNLSCLFCTGFYELRIVLACSIFVHFRTGWTTYFYDYLAYMHALRTSPFKYVENYAS